jgi:hypothetical protein
MYTRNAFKEEFNEWKRSLPSDVQDNIEFHQFDKSVDMLFLKRNGEIEEDHLNDLRATIREKDDRVRVGTFTRPPENDIREEVV